MKTRSTKVMTDFFLFPFFYQFSKTNLILPIDFGEFCAVPKPKFERREIKLALKAGWGGGGKSEI